MSWLWTMLSGAVTLAIAAWLVFRVSNRHVLRMCRAIPSAQPSLPILGNTLMFARSQEYFTENLLKVLDDSVLKGHRAVCFWLGCYPLVFITDPDDIRKVLNNSLSRGNEFEEIGEWIMKYGLLTSPVDHWKVTRRHLNSSFHHRNLEQLIPTFNETSRQLVADLSAHLDGVEFDLMPHVICAAGKTMGIFLYGAEFSECFSNEEIQDNKHSVQLGGELMALRMFKPWLRNKVLFKLIYGKELNCMRAVSLLLSVNGNKVSVEKTSFTGKYGTNAVHGEFLHGFHTILASMRELQKIDSSIRDEHVMDEIVSFFGAGTDTMGASVSSCLLALARFPAIQDKVCDEICAVWPEHEDQDVAHLDLKRLPYLDQVIKETLRFFTVVPLTARAPTRNIDLGGFTLPANKTAFIYLSSVNFDPKYFPDPHRFDPDRFSPENRTDGGVFAPFSRGARNCIGKEHSLLLMKVMVVHVVRRYRLSTNMDIYNLKKKIALTMTCCDGYNVCLTERSK